MIATFHVVKGAFVSASSQTVDEDEINRLVGVWAFNGWELERKCLRTPNDDNDLRLVIAREDGIVKCVAEILRPGVKELGLDRIGLEDIVRWASAMTDTDTP